MDKKYTLPEESPQMVCETISSYNVGKIIEVHVPSTGHYTEEELAKELSDYARRLVNQEPQMEPYTMEELNARIDKTEAEESEFPSLQFSLNELKDRIAKGIDEYRNGVYYTQEEAHSVFNRWAVEV